MLEMKSDIYFLLERLEKINELIKDVKRFGEVYVEKELLDGSADIILKLDELHENFKFRL